MDVRLECAHEPPEPSGGSGCVVSIDRVGQALRVHGGDLVVADLAELLER
jgi:hypothetical protein